jgi:hypothetical protein
MEPDIEQRERGLAARRRAYKGISFGTTLICIGAVLLLNTLNRLGWGVWFDLLRLWPLLLISLGIRSIFVPTRLHPLALLGPLLVVTATALTVSWYRGGGPDSQEALDHSVALSCPEPLRDAAARLHLTFAVGRMWVVSQRDEAATTQHGLDGTLRYAGEEPPWACSNEGDLWLGAEGSEGGLRILYPFGSGHELWEARLSSGHRVSVRGDILAATSNLDFRGFDLDRVDLDLAATSARIRLGTPARRVGVKLQGAASTVRLRMPEGTCFTITRERVFSVLRGDGLPPDRRRGRHVVGTGCPGGAEPAADVPRYDFRIELPFSTVIVEPDGGA